MSKAAEQAEVLAIIREECSPALSSVNIDAPQPEERGDAEPCTDCSCLEHNEKYKEKISPDDVQKLLEEKEAKLTSEFKERLGNEITILKERCEFILQNEQVRASYMLREAHRERQEKITALQTQLECKNLAGLMYVMCNERRKSKLEKLRIIEEYTNYIHALQDILTEAQSLILHLSRGYKTASRVDFEWREKMIGVLSEFQNFIHDYVKGTPDSEQFFFNMPELLSTKAPIVDNPNEDPCEIDEELLQKQQEGLEQQEKTWYDLLDDECRPFVMFGDMAEFQPPQRREVLRTVKAAKTAPRKWKNYVFNEMFVRAGCNNADSIKDEYPNRLPVDQWECQGQPEYNMSTTSRRTTATSIDMRGNMGSIIKIISSLNGPPQTKATLLGARDSMEIASTTKLKEREKSRHSERSRVVINVGNRHASYFNSELDADEDQPQPMQKARCSKDDESVDESMSALGSVHNDSLQVIPGHVPDQDKIHYEKICPMDKCQLMQVDSFIRTLPPYMRASPFTHFEQTYEDYETCTPEQLEILKKRIEDKKNRGVQQEIPEENPLNEWTPSVEGVAAQTSDISMSLPPCTCRVPSPSLVSSTGRIFAMEDLIPVKEALDKIHQECFYDSRIEFDRFKVIGQESNDSIKPQPSNKRDRLYEIKKVLKQHPSLLDIFQANAV